MSEFQWQKISFFIVPVAVKWSHIIPLASTSFPAEWPHLIFSAALSLFISAKMTIQLSIPIAHLWSVLTQTNILQIISPPFCFKLVFLSNMQLLLPFFLTLCYYPCRVASCCRAQTEKVITPVSSLHVYVKVADLNGVSFHFPEMNWDT